MLPSTPWPKTVRAISESIDGYSSRYGVACVTWASQATPASNTPRMHAIMVSTRRALRPCGSRNTLTVLEIASTPVSDVPPLANARNTTRTVAPITKPPP